MGLVKLNRMYCLSSMAVRRSQGYSATGDSIGRGQVIFATNSTSGITLPAIRKLWRSLAYNPKLGDLADVGRGIEFKKGCPVKRGGHSREILRHVDSELLHHQEPVPEKLVFSEDEVRFWGTAAQTGIPQIVVNAARVSRGPWPVWALMDRRGLTTSKRLITVRQKTGHKPCSLELFWALLTSPLASAFVHAMSGKRDLDTQTYENLPLPRLRDLCNGGAVERAVKCYVDKALTADGLALRTQALVEELKQLRLQVDAEVLKLYDLAPRDERKLLDLFSGHNRAGVPFEQTEYFSRDFKPFVPLHEYLSPEYKRSTAGEIRKIDFAKLATPALKEALKRAVELYSDEVTKKTGLAYAELKARLFERFAQKELRAKPKRVEQLKDPLTGYALGVQENDVWIVAQAVERGLVLVTQDKMIRIKEVTGDLELVGFEDWAGA